MTSSNFGFNLHITLAMALAGLTDLVQRFGESHTASLTGGCAYIEEVTSNGRLLSSCIVGKFFDDLGVLRVLLVDNDYGVHVTGSSLRNACGLGSDEEFRVLAASFGITFDEEAYTLLRVAQQQQDLAYAWGSAVETAAAAVLKERGEPMTAVQILALQAEDGDTGKPTVW